MVLFETARQRPQQSTFSARQVRLQLVLWSGRLSRRKDEYQRLLDPQDVEEDGLQERVCNLSRRKDEYQRLLDPQELKRMDFKKEFATCQEGRMSISAS